MTRIVLPETLRDSGVLPMPQLSALLRRAVEQGESIEDLSAFWQLATDLLELLAVEIASRNDPTGAASVQVAILQLKTRMDQVFSAKINDPMRARKSG